MRRPLPLQRSWAILLLLLLLVLLLGAHSSASGQQHAEDDTNVASPSPSSPSPSKPAAGARVTLRINPDGTASLVPIDDDSSAPGAGAASVLPQIILPGADSGAGLVPLWQLESEKRAAAELKRAEEEEAERIKRQEQEEQQRLQADSSSAEAEADAARVREARAQRAASDAADAAEAARHAEEEASNRERRRASQERQRQRDEEEADAIAAAAAKAYAESGLVKVEDGGNTVASHDPAQALLDSLLRASFFRELLPHNAWSYVQQGRPFAVLILCSCARDDDLRIAALENLLMADGLHHRFSFLWVRSPTREQFHMGHTYGLDMQAPAFIIDNIPIGQHVEKYAFPQTQLSRPASATPEQLRDFLALFLLAPTPLQLMARSQDAPPVTDASSDPVTGARGRVFEVVGSTFESIVLHTSAPVLLMLHSPTCPACRTAALVLDDLAHRLAWSMPDVIVARMDRTQNDPPMVLRFSAYPAFMLFGASADGTALGKRYDSSAGGGEEPQQRGLMGSRGWRAPRNYHDDTRGQSDAQQQQGSCNAPLDVQALEEWIRQQTGAGNRIGMGAAMDAQQHLAQSQPNSVSASDVDSPTTQHQHVHRDEEPAETRGSTTQGEAM